ncbi:MAG: alkaline phosphatase family protein [Bacteroidia bacterium]
MKKILLVFLIITTKYTFAQLPKPDHIVVVMFQNKNYSSIVGSSNAPYINSLIADTNTALFTQSYALTHPSQPNYLMLYSGSNQGVTTDIVPTNTPFTTCNLGASLLSAGHTFTGYSESMPSPGYLGISTSLYYRKHNPWSDWQGTGPNALPASVNQPFTSFPGNYNLLPDVAIVVPNIINCMHDGTIQQGDTWLKNNISQYVAWVKTHNSLLIITFDEGDSGGDNHILTLFLGPMVKQGSYNTRITHYNVLRTLEDIYKVTACGASATSAPITEVWKSPSVGVSENSNALEDLTIWPIPTKDQLNITISSTISENNIEISLVDLTGKSAKKKKVDIIHGENKLDFNTKDLPRGVYLLNITGKEIKATKKIIIE